MFQSTHTTGPDNAVAKSPVHGVVDTGFASSYRLCFFHAQWVDVKPLHPHFSLISIHQLTKYIFRPSQMIISVQDSMLEPYVHMSTRINIKSYNMHARARFLSLFVTVGDCDLLHVPARVSKQ